MKKSIFALISVMFLAACGMSIEEKADKEAKDFTRKNCPTPVVNCQCTDSIVFNSHTRTFINYCRFFDVLDDEKFISSKKDDINKELDNAVANNYGMKTFVDEGFTFEYIIRSASNPKKVLLQHKVKLKK